MPTEQILALVIFFVVTGFVGWALAQIFIPIINRFVEKNERDKLELEVLQYQRKRRLIEDILDEQGDR